MQLLIDTQIFIWFISGAPELKPNIKRLVEDENTRVYISIASLWEISIKTALGKLDIHGAYESVIDDVTGNDIEILPISFAHTVQQHKLPFYHKDPFDRIIVAQAIVEKLDLVSSDAVFEQYLTGETPNRIW
jgi:PIN domain nuclease of toxin-antitoxin system